MKSTHLATPSLLLVAFLATTALVTLALPAFSQGAELAADLNPGPEPQGSRSQDFVRVGGELFFLRNPNRELELWRTDGSADGTVLVRVLDIQTASTELIGGELPDGRLIFSAHDPVFGQEPWVSDGTRNGSRLYADLCPGDCSSFPGTGPFPHGIGFVRWRDQTLFSAEVEGNTFLFATDGSQVPRRLSDVRVRIWGASGERLFILEPASFGEPRKIWVNEGSPASDRLVQELDIGLVRAFIPFKGGMLLVVSAASGDDFEVYFGDEAGFELILELSGENQRGFRQAIAGDSLAYLVFEERGGCRLFRTDGTVADQMPTGTFELEPVNMGGGCVRVAETVGDRLFFDLDTSASGTELWTSDGTAAGTLLVQDIAPGPPSSSPTRLTASAGMIYFMAENSAGPGLWRSDGTAGGTELVRAFQQTDSGLVSAPGLGLLGDQLFFVAADFDLGLEVWSSDGTAGGTALVANLSPDVASSNPRSPLAGADNLVFLANLENSFDLVRIDGGHQIEPLGLSLGDQGQILGRAGRHILLSETSNPTSGPASLLAVEAATGLVENLLQVPWIFETEVVGDQLFLASGLRIGSFGHRATQALWRTDGTPNGTVELFSHNEGGSFTSLPGDLQGFRDILHFSNISDAATGAEFDPVPWLSDGSRDGTQRLTDILPGVRLTQYLFLGASRDQLFLAASVDGEPRSLVVLDSELRIQHRQVPFSRPLTQAAVVLGSRLIWHSFLAASTGELWSSDGTPAGTRLLGEFDHVSPLVVSGGQVFFTTSTGNFGNELWVTDGTARGTRMVRDILLGSVGSHPRSLRDVGGILVFAAYTEDSGTEVWASDGTRLGTRRIADVNPGARGSDPADFSLLGDQVYFSAYRPDVGRELFVFPRKSLTLPCTAGETTLCLNEDRFIVDVQWGDFTGNTGAGQAVALTADTGYFWFFDDGNVEVVVKVLDGCVINNHFWVFAAGLTNVDVTLTVTDTETGQKKTYGNALGNPFVPVQDTVAFASCPG